MSELPLHHLTAEQAECLVSPLRDALLQAVLARSPVAASDLVDQLGIHEKSIYYHLRKLEKVGLIRVMDHRAGPTKPEALYGPIAQRMRWKPEADRPEHRDLANRHFRTILRRAEREARAASELTPRREIVIQSAHRRLRSEHVDELVVKLKELGAWIAEKHDPEGEVVSYGAFVIPIASRSSF